MALDNGNEIEQYGLDLLSVDTYGHSMKDRQITVRKTSAREGFIDLLEQRIIELRICNAGICRNCLVRIKIRYHPF